MNKFRRSVAHVSAFWQWYSEFAFRDRGVAVDALGSRSRRYVYDWHCGCFYGLQGILCIFVISFYQIPSCREFSEKIANGNCKVGTSTKSPVYFLTWNCFNHPSSNSKFTTLPPHTTTTSPLLKSRSFSLLQQKVSTNTSISLHYSTLHKQLRDQHCTKVQREFYGPPRTDTRPWLPQCPTRAVSALRVSWSTCHTCQYVTGSTGYLITYSHAPSHNLLAPSVLAIDVMAGMVTSSPLSRVMLKTCYRCCNSTYFCTAGCNLAAPSVSIAISGTDCHPTLCKPSIIPHIRPPPPTCWHVSEKYQHRADSSTYSA